MRVGLRPSSPDQSLTLPELRPTFGRKPLDRERGSARHCGLNLLAHLSLGRSGTPLRGGGVLFRHAASHGSSVGPDQQQHDEHDGHREGEFREDNGGGLHGWPRISLIARSRTNRATSTDLAAYSSSGHASHRCPTSSSAQCWSVVSTSSNFGRRLAIAISALLLRAWCGSPRPPGRTPRGSGRYS